MRQLLIFIILFATAPQALAQPNRRRATPPPTLAALEAELAAVRDSGAPQRLIVLRKFARVKSAECVTFLAALHSSEGDASVRLEVLRVIGRVGVEPASEVLASVLARGKQVERSTALSALGTIRPVVDPAPFHARVADPDLGVRTQAIMALGNYPNRESAEALTRLLTDEALPANLRTHTVRSLAKVLKAQAVRPWLRDTALAPRGPYAGALADLLHLAGGVPKASRDLRESITPHLDARDPLVRAAAADALGQLLKGQASFAEHTLSLLAPLLRDPDPGVVLSAGVAIGQIVPVGSTFDAVLSLCRAKSPALRAVAVGALEGSRDPRVVPAARKALGDKARPVRAAAIATLAAHGTRDAITALVDGLKKNKQGRLEHELLAALRRLTRANPGPHYKAWKRWWSEAKDDFQLPKSGSVQASARKSGETATRGVPTYYGTEIVSRRVTFIVDVSGSMSAQVKGKGTSGESLSRMERCKRELQGVIETLPKKAHFNVVWFNNSFTSWMPQLTQAGKQQKASALKAVGALKAGGGTNLFDPLEAALKDPDVDTIYLLSDGAPSSGRIVDPAAILREVRKLNAARQVAIHTISIGSRSPLMRDLAREHAGQAIQR